MKLVPLVLKQEIRLNQITSTKPSKEGIHLCTLIIKQDLGEDNTGQLQVATTGYSNINSK